MQVVAELSEAQHLRSVPYFVGLNPQPNLRAGQWLFWKAIQTGLMFF
jgi:hypothetical protein